MHDFIRGHGLHACACVVLSVLLSGCTDQAPASEPTTGDADMEMEPAVTLTWQPEAQRLPMPSDLVRNSTSGRLALDEDSTDISAAERRWRQWLNRREGYPVESSLRFPVEGGALDPTKDLTGGVVLLKQGESRLGVSASFDASHDMLTVNPVDEQGQRTYFEPSSTYEYAIWGYEQGLVGSQGEPVVADSLFLRMHSSEPAGELSELERGLMQGGDGYHAEIYDEFSSFVKGILPSFEPYGLYAPEVAVAGSFTTDDVARVWNDPQQGKVPRPSHWLFDTSSQHINLPVQADDSEEVAHLKDVLSGYDGFSTRASILFEVSEKVDTASALEPGVVRLFRYDSDRDELVEETDLERHVMEDGRTISIRPSLALEPASTYLHVVTGGLKTEQGKPVIAQPQSALMTFDSPLYENGKSTVSVLSDDEASRLEPERAKVDTLLTRAEMRYGVSREDIAFAGVFRTVDVVSYLMDRRAKLYREDLRTDVVNVLSKSPSARGLPFVLRDVETVVTGQVTVMDHLDKRTLRVREDGLYEERQVDFLLTIPEGANKGEPIPTVIFGHGLATSRELLYMIAQKLAEHGYAAITLDLPYHGERAICVRDTDCASNATCGEDRQCVNADGSRGELNRLESVIADGPSYPVTSGEPFILIDDLEASRDHFAQALLDMHQLIRVVRSVQWGKVTGGYELAGDDLVYLGMSLGGILGSMLTVLEPGIDSFVLNVPGAGLLEMMENSPAFSTLYQRELERQGIDFREGADYMRFQDMVYWVLDVVDPVNVVQHTIKRPARYEDPETGEVKVVPFKRVMLQMAESDSVVPNITTQILSERMGVEYRTYTPAISNHAFLFDPTSFEGGRARNDMVEFYDAR